MKKNRIIELKSRVTTSLLSLVALINIFGLSSVHSEVVLGKRDFSYLQDTTITNTVDSTKTDSTDQDLMIDVDSANLITDIDSTDLNLTLDVDSTTIIHPDSIQLALQDSTLISKDSINILDKSEVIGGVMPLIEEKLLESNYVTKSDSVKKKEVEVRRPFSQLALERSPIFKDTISVKNMTLYSLLAPGFSQLYNHDYFKIPIIYGALGGFVSYGVIVSKKHSDAKIKYNSVVGNSNYTTSEIAAYRSEMDKYSTQQSLMIAGAALTYVYSLSDGIINYKGEIHPTRKATILSAIFPGAGQLYNKKYWKLPIVYGGLATFAYIIDFNNRGYQRFKLAYNLLTDGDDSTVDEFGGNYSESTLQNTRNSYRRYRDLGIIMTAGFYLLQVVDAHVDAYLSRYDISNDLAMSVEPTIIDNNMPFKSSQSSSNRGFGMGLRIDF